MIKVLLGRRYRFSALHTIPQEDFIHGHNYELDLCFKGPLQEAGWIYSRESLDQVVHENFINRINRKWVNEITLPATGENLALFAYQKISKALPDGIELDHLELHETRKNSFIVKS